MIMSSAVSGSCRLLVYDEQGLLAALSDGIVQQTDKASALDQWDAPKTEKRQQFVIQESEQRPGDQEAFTDEHDVLHRVICDHFLAPWGRHWLTGARGLGQSAFTATSRGRSF
jgi:hypothetical protein